MKRRVIVSLFLVAVVGLVLTACNPASLVRSVTFNGVTALDLIAGTADLSISALGSGGKVLSTGTLTAPTASVTSASDAGGPVSTSYSATASVCRNITGQSGVLTAMLALDATGSMSGSDPSQLRAGAAKDFIDRMTAGDTAAVSSFDTSTIPSPGYLAIKVHQNLTSDKTALKTAVDAATFNGGATNLWDAGVDSVQYFTNQHVTSSNKLVVLLTDGQDNSSSKLPADVISSAQATGVRVFTIGLGSYVDTLDLVTIANQTGGTYSQVQNAADLTGLFDGIFNASQAAGCIRVKFTPLPTSGRTLAGKLTFKVDNNPVSTNYQVTFP